MREGRGSGMTSRQLKLAQQTTSKSSPEAAAGVEEEDEGWKHPAELIYSIGRYWTDKKVIFYLISNALAVSPVSETSPGVTYVTDGKKTIALNEEYRIPIMWALKWQFNKLKSILTAEESERSRKWPSEKYEILHVSRVWKILTDEGPSGEDYGLQFRIEEIKQWRCWTLERVLTRFRMGCFSSEPSRVSKFWDKYGEAEYMKNPLKFDWRTFTSEGHEGITLTDSEIEAGLDPQKLMEGLKEKDGHWFWETDSNPVPGGTPAWSLRDEARLSFSAKSLAAAASKSHGPGSGAAASKSRSRSKDSHKDSHKDTQSKEAQSISAALAAKPHSLQTESLKPAPVSTSSPLSNAENESSQTPPRIRRSQNSISGIMSSPSIDTNGVNGLNNSSSISSAMPLSNQGLTNAAIQTPSPASLNYLRLGPPMKKQESKPQNSPTSVSAVSQTIFGAPPIQRAPSGAGTSSKPTITTSAPPSNPAPPTNSSTNSVAAQKLATSTPSANTSPKIPGLNLNTFSVMIPSPSVAPPHKSKFSRPPITGANSSMGASPIPTPSPTPTPTSAGSRPPPSSTAVKQEASTGNGSGNTTPAKTAGDSPFLALCSPQVSASPPSLPKSEKGTSRTNSEPSKNTDSSNTNGGITTPRKTAEEKRPPYSPTISASGPGADVPGFVGPLPPPPALPKSEQGTSISMPIRKTGLTPGARVQSPVTPPPTFMMPVKMPVNGIGNGNGAPVSAVSGTSSTTVATAAAASTPMTTPLMSSISAPPSAAPKTEQRPATPTSPIFTKSLLPFILRAVGTSTSAGTSAPASAPGAGVKRPGSPLEQPSPSKKTAGSHSNSSSRTGSGKASPAPAVAAATNTTTTVSSKLNSPAPAHGWSAPPMPLDHLIGGRTTERKAVRKSGKGGQGGDGWSSGSNGLVSLHPLAHLLGSRVGAGKDG